MRFNKIRRKIQIKCVVDLYYIYQFMNNNNLTSPKNSLIEPQFNVRSKSVYPTKKVVNQQFEIPQQYTLIEKVGQGSFGEIFKLYDTVNKKLIACKVEFKDSKQPNQQPLLIREYKVLEQLKQLPSVPSIQKLVQNHDCNLIMMPYYGSGNLEELRKKQKNTKFTKKTIMLLGMSLVQALEDVHQKFYIHRDIKPENFMVGSLGDHHKVYLIDYGLAKQYMDNNNQHIPMATNKGMVGTARYTSINSHIGLEQSRRDDLEAVGYVLIYLYCGNLPWQNFNCQSRQEKFQKILEQKMKYSSNQITIECPEELKKYVDYVRQLQFDEKPDYDYLKSLFEAGLQSEQQKKHKFCYDWCNQNCTIMQLDQDNDIISNEVPNIVTGQQLKENTTRMYDLMEDVFLDVDDDLPKVQKVQSIGINDKKIHNYKQ